MSLDYISSEKDRRACIGEKIIFNYGLVKASPFGGEMTEAGVFMDAKKKYVDLPNGACLKRMFKKYSLVKESNKEHRPDGDFFLKMV